MSEAAPNDEQIDAKTETKSEESVTDGGATVDRKSSIADDNTCVVCFKNTEIYSIGECDHPVCYECSTRMRVLCQQNECPICRQNLSKVIFTHDKLPYRELEAKNRSEYYSKQYKISFYNRKIQQAFFKLLDHPCPKCDAPPYRTFQGLRNHVRKEHDMHYCDLCVENLKIFTFERRCYTQAELGLHRTKGDADNRSHRGHPLCEYCSKRFLDRDELFRHLRREHYFCHFCDADGCNEFYRDYPALAEHFRQDHFLCEEGKCANEQFTGAFRTEIDYKAHVANVHGKSLNKQQAKQTRTLQLEITLGPRDRTTQMGPGYANMRTRGTMQHREEPAESEVEPYAQCNTRPTTIDASNDQDFPSLGGASGGPNASLARPMLPTMRHRGNIAGLARTKENFPALGGEASGGSSQRPLSNQSVPPPISAMLRKPPPASTGAIARTPTKAATNSNGPGMMIHLSNRPAHPANASNGPSRNKKASTSDFPALSAAKHKKGGRNLEEDMPTSPEQVPMSNVSAKHRTLVDDYVSVANPSNFQKLQMVQKEELEAKARKEAEKTSAPKLTSQDFPSLGPSSAKPVVASNTWAKAPAKTGSDKRQRELENRKAKVAPAPLLTKESKATNNKPATNNNPIEQTVKKDKKNKEKNTANGTQQNKTQSEGKSKEHNNNENKAANKNSSLSQLVNGNVPETAPAPKAPPPGFFSQSAAVKPPPGFHSNVIVNSVAKSPNNLTFTSSLGQSYNIVPTHAYLKPPNAGVRDKKLVSHFRDSFKTPEALMEFRHLSQSFLDGHYKAPAYYEHCQSALKDKFDYIFPELVALLPNISKQQELYLVHTQRLNTMSPNERKSLPRLEVCSTCKQVMQTTDCEQHRSAHTLEQNFPAFSGGSSAGTGATRK